MIMETDRDRLILDNLQLIHKVIKDLHLYFDTEDEYQEYYDYGLEGLIKAVDKYDSSKYKQSTFFYPCIKNMVLRCVYEKNRAKNKNKFGKDISLDKVLANEGEKELLLEDVLKDLNINIEEEVEKKLEIERLLMAVNKLKNEKDKLIIKMYYGLDNFNQMSMDKIAVKFGISRSAIGQKITRARRKLREYLQKNDKEVFMIEQKNTYVQKNDSTNKSDKNLMKNNLKSLNDYLFEELERLNDDESLVGDNLEKELKRSKAITQVSNQIVQNAKVILDAKKHCDQFGDKLDNFYSIDSDKKRIANNPYEEFGKNL